MKVRPSPRVTDGQAPSRLTSVILHPVCNVAVSRARCLRWLCSSTRCTRYHSCVQIRYCPGWVRFIRLPLANDDECQQTLSCMSTPRQIYIGVSGESKKYQFQPLFLSRDKSDLMKQCASEICWINAHPA